MKQNKYFVFESNCKHVQQIWSEYENYDNREVPRNLRYTLLF